MNVRFLTRAAMFAACLSATAGPWAIAADPPHSQVIYAQAVGSYPQGSQPQVVQVAYQGAGQCNTCNGGNCQTGGYYSGGCQSGGCYDGSYGGCYDGSCAPKCCPFCCFRRGAYCSRCGGGGIGGLFGRGRAARGKQSYRSGMYPLEEHYRDARDNQVYAAQGYGAPVSVPLAPVIGYQYNYGWGLPASRLTRVEDNYTQYHPQQWPQTGGWGQQSTAKQIYWPTDTTQMGFYGVRAPHWNYHRLPPFPELRNVQQVARQRRIEHMSGACNGADGGVSYGGASCPPTQGYVTSNGQMQGQVAGKGPTPLPANQIKPNPQPNTSGVASAPVKTQQR